MKRVLLFSLVALFLSCKGSLQSVILRGPRSRIVPRGAVATFKCVFQNPRNPHWRVNDIDYNEHQIQYFRSRGFFVEPNQQDSSGAEILTLRVDSSFGGVNNTAIFCRDFGPISSDATSIIVINGKQCS